MRRVQFLVLTGLAVASAVLAQPSGMQAPIAGSPKVELKGKIEKIQLAMGQGMPYLEVRTTDKTVRVVLGSNAIPDGAGFQPEGGGRSGRHRLQGERRRRRDHRDSASHGQGP